MTRPSTTVEVKHFEKCDFYDVLERGSAETLVDACHMLAEKGSMDAAWEDAALQAMVAKSGFSIRTVRKQLSEARKAKADCERGEREGFFKSEEDAVEALKPLVGVYLTKKDTRFLLEKPASAGGYSNVGEESARAFLDPLQYEGVNSKGDPQLYPAFRAYLQSPHRRVHYGITCDPRLPKFGNHYNTWSGLALRPSATASCAKIIDLIRNVICGRNDKDFALTIEFLAHMIQKPEEKPGCMLILQGEKGLGKSTLADLMRKIIGPRHSMKISQARHIAGNFNEHLSECLLLQVEELGWAGDQEMEGILKDLITSDRLTVEVKNGAVEERFNMTRPILCTNRGWAFAVSKDERRVIANTVVDPWADIQDREERSRKSKAYFDALHAEINHGGAEAFLHYLQQHKLGSVDLRRPHVTAGLRRQAQHSLNAAGRWLIEALETGTFNVGEGSRAVTDYYVKTTDGGTWKESIEAEWPRNSEVAVGEASLKRSFLSAVRHHGPLTSAALVEALSEHVTVRATRVHVGKERPRVIILPSRDSVAALLHQRGQLELDVTEGTSAPTSSGTVVSINNGSRRTGSGSRF